MYSFKTCRHIMTNGRTCKSPAMRGSAYCYFHGPQKRATRTGKPTESEIEIQAISEPSDIPLVGNQILQAMAAKRISSSRASVMLQTLQTVMASFRMAANDALDPSGRLEP
jgi:hypothetical protein